MDTFLANLFSLVEEHFATVCTPEDRKLEQLRERHFAAVRAGMGQEFCEKLQDAVDECAWKDREAAFFQGLRLGLALHRL